MLQQAGSLATTRLGARDGRMQSLFALTLTLVLTGATIASAEAAGIYDEFRGLRSEAMGGAHRGLGTSNDTLTLNPAGDWGMLAAH